MKKFSSFRVYSLFTFLVMTFLSGIVVKPYFILTDNPSQRVQYVLGEFNFVHSLATVFICLIVYLILEFFENGGFKDEK
ncbi:hypothetical protein KGP38_07275 [Lactococcus lactis]|uniref:hypothetical protein n=1 Tax=Lactococcus lactis TaxID=1358 RepID=UPI001C20061D|nr:hypothetical protein [Lactococcus lactis]MBU7542398.1 hypothetical protein [Lactococcus lactis]